jgi:hypothetical protein
MSEPGQIILAVRIDERDSNRKFDARLMVIDHDHVEPELACLAECFRARGAAIDGDEQTCAARVDIADSLDIRTVAFVEPVRNVKERIAAGRAEHAHQERRRCGAIDVVVADDRDLFGVLYGIGKACGRGRHVGQYRRIGHQTPDRGVEKILDFVEGNVASGENAREQFRQAVALADRGSGLHAAQVQPVAPDTAADRALDTEEGSGFGHGGY